MTRRNYTAIVCESLFARQNERDADVVRAGRSLSGSHASHGANKLSPPIGFDPGYFREGGLPKKRPPAIPMSAERIMQLVKALRSYGSSFPHRDIADDFVHSAAILEAVAQSPVALSTVNSRLNLNPQESA